MKVTTQQKSVKNKDIWKFPCLGKSKRYGQIVLFSSDGLNEDYGEGMVIKRGATDEYDVGDWRDNWEINDFKPCPLGFQVILEND